MSNTRMAKIMSWAAVIVLLLSPLGCNLPVASTSQAVTPTIPLIIEPTPTLNWAAMPPVQRYVMLMLPQNAAPDGLPVVASLESKGQGAKQQTDYFKQVFNKTAKEKKINILTQKATYGQRGLLSGEKIDQIIAFQFKDGLAAAFVITATKSERHTYFVDPSGPVFELYLVAETTTPAAFFERDAAKAADILADANLAHAQWVAARQVNREDWSSYHAAQQDLLNSLYQQVRMPEQPALLKDAAVSGSPWLLVPVLWWDAKGDWSVMINPSSLELHLENSPALQTETGMRGVFLGLPAGVLAEGVIAAAAVEPEAPAEKPSPTPKAAATKKPAKKPSPTPTSQPVVDSGLKQNLEAFEKGQVMISNEKLFRTSGGINPLGIADARDVGMSWGFFVQAVYLGSTDVQMKGYKNKVRVAVFGFTDAAGNHYFVPCQLGVDLDHPVIIQYDSNRTISSLDNERPVTLKASETLDVLRANLNEPVLIFLMRSSPPFPLSDSDGYYINAHDRQYPAADLVLRYIKAAASGDSRQIQAPEVVNAYNFNARILPLVENLILPNKLPK